MNKFLFITLFICFTISAFSQSIWTNPITDGNPSASDPFTLGQTVVPNLTVSGIGRGSGISANAGSNRYNAINWAASLDLNDYFYFTLTPANGFALNLTSFVYTGQASGTGPNTFAFRSSKDNYGSNIGSVTVGNVTVSLSAVQYQNQTSAITFRFYGWGGASTGTFSINDFTFNGTITPAAPLGLDLISFTGQNKEGSNELNWTSASEVNFSHFEIERSTDGRNFNYLGRLNSNQTLSTIKPYSYQDTDPAPEKNYYRLKQIDNDATFEYSKVIAIQNTTSKINMRYNMQHQEIVIEGKTGSGYFLIYDIEGRLILRRAIEESQTLNLRDLPMGTYVAMIENNASAHLKFIVRN